MERITLAHQRIGFLNFAGRDDKGFNENHNRSFTIFLEDPELVDQLLADGFNVKLPDPNKEVPEGSLPPSPRLEVTVSKGPLVKPSVRVYLREEEGMPANRIPNDALNQLDSLRYEYADIVINPYEWQLKSGKSGVKAYLQTIYLNMAKAQPFVDEFAAKYGISEE